MDDGLLVPMDHAKMTRLLVACKAHPTAPTFLWRYRLGV
jgi:hypothetical protein